MADGWRNRNMAPVYALVMSFVLVLLFGVILQRGAKGDDGQETHSQDKQTTSDEQSKAPAGWKFQVSRLDHTDGHPPEVGSDQKPENFEAIAIWGHKVKHVDDLTDLSAADIHDKVVVCVKLPENWAMPDPAPMIGSYTCSEPLTPEKDTVQVEMQGG
jgi:hypothetical protein